MLGCYLLCWVLILSSGCIICFRPSFYGRFTSRLTNSLYGESKVQSFSMLAETVPFRPKPIPGSPIVRYVYSNNNLALLSVCVPGSATHKAFTDTCDRFNEDARVNKRRINGLPVGEKLPYQALYDLYGEAQVKNHCCNFLSEAIAEECEQSGLKIIGEGRVTEFNADLLIPGMPHVLELECDLMPKITYNGTEDGYKGLKVTTQRTAINSDKFVEVKKRIRERYAVLQDTSPEYTAQLGDTVMVNMRGFERSGGRDTTQLLTSGERVPLHLDRRKILPELVDTLLNAKVGDQRQAEVDFPVQIVGSGVSMAGKNVTFEMEVLEVRTCQLPAWDDSLAALIRENLTIAALEIEMMAAVAEDAATGTEVARNDALSRALIDIAHVSRIPEALVEANTKMRYHNKRKDAQQQGATAEQIATMDSPEQYTSFATEVRADAEMFVKLSLIFQDIIDKETSMHSHSNTNTNVSSDGINGSSHADTSSSTRSAKVTTTPINFTTANGATITGTVTTTNEPETDNSLTVTPLEVQNKLDSMDELATVLGNPPVNRKEIGAEVASMLLRKKVFNFLASHADITFINPAPVV